MAISNTTVDNCGSHADFIVGVRFGISASKILETCTIAQYTDRIWHDVVFRRTGVHTAVPSVGGTIHIAHLGAVIHGAFSGHPRVADAVVCSLPVVPWGPYGIGHLGGTVFIGLYHAHCCGIVLGNGGDCDTRLLQPRNPKRDVGRPI